MWRFSSLRPIFATTQGPARVQVEKVSLSRCTLAEIHTKAYISAMQKLAIVVPLVLFLAASVWFGWYVWAYDTGAPMPTSGYVAMALGVLFSLVVGIGLMALVFYSHRHGYDDQQGGQDGV
jgi:hypothetical protein